MTTIIWHRSWLTDIWSRKWKTFYYTPVLYSYMLWVLKSKVSYSQFFWVTTTNVLVDEQDLIFNHTPLYKSSWCLFKSRLGWSRRKNHSLRRFSYTLTLWILLSGLIKSTLDGSLCKSKGYRLEIPNEDFLQSLQIVLSQQIEQPLVKCHTLQHFTWIFTVITGFRVKKKRLKHYEISFQQFKSQYY